MKEADRISGLSPIKRAFLAIDELQGKLDAIEHARTESIAIVGMACRFPHAAGLEEFWNVLRDGIDAIREIPPDRWDADALYDANPDAPGKMYTRWGGFLDAVDMFDADFFGISPREAAAMDPQQRTLLEVMWEALEHAGQAADQLAGSATGVFLGMCNNDYGQLTIRSADLSRIDAYAGIGSAGSIASGRISYILGIHGPSVVLDTACSSSLVALHLACQSLRTNECRMAIVGGVNAILRPEVNINFSKARMLAPDGRCKTFDASADGYVRGEGCGVIVLKRLSTATVDNDHVHAIIRSTAVNQDGRSNGLTAPNGPAQEAVIRRALAEARIEPRDVGYVEAHGTGTALGDPIEVQALGRVLRQGRPLSEPFLMGSVKTNIGHLEAAAGVAGLIKTVLALEHGVIPPHLHLKKKNPYINWDEIPVQIPTQVTPWPSWQRRRIAGVSSFGFSGTNAHVVIEQAPEVEAAAGKEEAAEREHVVTLSARSEAALQELVERYGKAMCGDRSMRLGDSAWTANVGRAQFNERVAVVGSSCTEVGEKLKRGEYKRGRQETGRRVKVGFLFSGQGSQYVGMGRELYESEEEFRQWMNKAAGVVEEETGGKLLEVMWGRTEGLDETEWTQPALYTVEYALAQQWKQWGVEATAVMGHSIGEYAAAAVAGVLEWEQGLRLVTRRGRMMQRLGRGGGMAAVYASGEEVEKRLRRYAGRVTIAAWNGREQVTIAGEEEGVEELSRELREAGRRVERLRVSEGFHSQRMEPMLEELEREIGKAEFKRPERTLVLNLTGEVSDGEEIRRPAYWRRQAREAVRFEAGVKRLAAEVDVIVEVGPTPVLLGLGMEAVEKAGLVWTASMSRKRKDRAQMLEAAAELYVAGVNLDWDAIDGPQHKVVLPTYPFQRQRYWMEPVAGRTTRPTSTMSSTHPLLGAAFRSPAISGTIFESELSLERMPFLADHRVFEKPVLPATAYVEMALAAAKHSRCELVVRNIEIHVPLVLSEERPITVQLILRPGNEPGRFSFEIVSQSSFSEGNDRWQTHATGEIGGVPAETTPVSLSDLQDLITREVPVDAYYDKLKTFGLNYGESFRNLQELRVSPQGVLGRIRAVQDRSYSAHPAMFDSCLQIVGAFGLEMPVESRDLYLPTEIAEFRLNAANGAIESSVWSYARIRLEASSVDQISVDFLIFGETGAVLAEFNAIQFRRLHQEEWAGSAPEEAANLELLARLQASDAAERVRLLTAEVRDHTTRVLGHTSGVDLDVRRPFNELGLDSIMAVELTKSLSRTFGIGLFATVLFTRPTVEALAAHVGEELHLFEKTDDISRPIGETLREDAVLDPSIRPALPVSVQSPAASIFLTGATGFLGAELLRELLTQTEARIHCLVRAADPERARERLLSKLGDGLPAAALQRIIAVVGDLAEPYFGLTTDAYSALAEDVDTIFHCGAVVDVVAPYNIIKPPNVDATRQVLHLACHGQAKRVHYVSTLSVFMSPKYIAMDCVMENDPLEDSNGYPAGYIQSKWVAEKLVSEAQSRGLPVAVYRPPVITGHSVTGECKLDDVTPRMIKGCIQLGMTPRLKRPALDFAPVDYVSRAIVHISRNPECFGKAFHIKHKATLTWEQIAEHMRQFGYIVREVDYPAWLQALRKAPTDNPLSHFLAYFEETPEEMLTLPSLDRSNTMAFLAGSSIVDTAMEELLDAYLHYFFSIGFIPAASRHKTPNPD